MCATKKVALLVVGAVLLGALLLFTYSKYQLHIEKKMPEGVVKLYLYYLETNDRRSLRNLAPSSYDSNFAIEEKISLYKGVDYKSLTVEYVENPISSGVKKAMIFGYNKDGSAFFDSIDLEIDNRGKWHVILGNYIPPN